MSQKFAAKVLTFYEMGNTRFTEYLHRCSIGVCYEGGLVPDGSPKDTRTPVQRRALSKLLTDLKRLFPRALIRGHCEMPGAVPKACPCYKPSREYRFIK